MSTDTNTIEKQEEAKFKAKYPNLKMGPASSALLQKRMGRGPRYFDSGDYQMAKAKGNIKVGVPILKPSIPASAVNSKEVQDKDAPTTHDEFIQPTGIQIPTVESVSHRKPSLIQSNLVFKPSGE